MRRIFNLFLILTLILGAISAWASCPSNIAPVEYTGSQAVDANSGTVCSVVYTYNGVVAGTKIQLYDSLSASGTVRLTLVAATTAGSIIKEYPYGAYFGTGIFYKEAEHSGTIVTDIQTWVN